MSGYTVTLTDSEYDALKARIRELEALVQRGLNAVAALALTYRPNKYTDECRASFDTFLLDGRAALKHKTGSAPSAPTAANRGGEHK